MGRGAWQWEQATKAGLSLVAAMPRGRIRERLRLDVRAISGRIRVSRKYFASQSRQIFCLRRKRHTRTSASGGTGEHAPGGAIDVHTPPVLKDPALEGRRCRMPAVVAQINELALFLVVESKFVESGIGVACRSGDTESCESGCRCRSKGEIDIGISSRGPGGVCSVCIQEETGRRNPGPIDGFKGGNVFTFWIDAARRRMVDSGRLAISCQPLATTWTCVAAGLFQRLEDFQDLSAVAAASCAARPAAGKVSATLTARTE